MANKSKKSLDINGLEYVASKVMTLVNSGGSADYLVEEGTEGIWTYRKWASGIAECWGQQTYPSATFTQAYSFYYRQLGTTNYPSGLFIEPPTLQITIGHNSIATGGTGYGSNTKDGFAAVAIAQIDVARDVIAFYTARGLWKEFTPDIMKTPSLDLYYQVGSIYQTSNANFDPNVTFGGTWELITNKFLIGAGDEYENGETGGEATHTLTINEMPSHNHGEKSLSGYLYAYAWGDGSSSGIVTKTTGAKNMTMSGGSTIGHIGYTVDATHTHNANGSGVAHNNLPPYKAVFMWERTA